MIFSVELELRNEGRGVAEGIDVQLTLPEEIFLYQPSPVESPPPPEQPRWRSRLGAIDESIAMTRPSGLGAIAFTEALVREKDGVLEHDEAHPHVAKLHLPALKHSMVFPLNVPLWYADPVTALAATGFSIGYRVHADNLPDINNGELRVKLDVPQIPLTAYHIKRK